MYLSIRSVFNFLKTSPESRNIREGEEVVNSNHLIACGVSAKDNNCVNIFSLCLQTSALNSNPHEIIGTIRWNSGDQDGAMIEKFLCSCKAGQSEKCKHIAAVLLFLTRCNIDDLEILSQTDKACTWNHLKAPTLDKYKPRPLMETPCFENKIPSVKFNNNFEKSLILSFLTEGCDSTALAKHKTGRRSYVGLLSTSSQEIQESHHHSAHEDINEIYNFFMVEGDLMRELSQYSVPFLNNCCKSTFNGKFSKEPREIFAETKYNKGVWQSERQFRITGSRCYSIYTYSLEDRWKKKAVGYFWPKSITTQPMIHGIVSEKLARETYTKVKGVQVIETGLLVSKLNPWLGFSPDGIVLEDGKPFKLLEIKCVQIGKVLSADLNNKEFVKNCRFLTTKEGQVSLNKRNAYYGQVQLGMAMLDLSHTDFIIFATFDNSFICLTIEFDYEYCKEMLFKIKHNFYNNMLHVICEYD